MQHTHSTPPPVFHPARLRWPRHALAALLVCSLGALAPAAALAFGFDDVAAEAAELARSPYRAPPPPDPALAALSYDGYRRLGFRPDAALWRDSGSPFEVMFYALGRGNTRALRLHEVVGGEVRPIRLTRGAFRPNGVVPPAPLAGPADAPAGAAGWRFNFPLNDAGRKDELVSFLGSSYFRALGAGQRYGLSARGVAVDTVGGQGEEFPAFTAFWLLRPAPGAAEATVFALLDSPRLAGAYRFTIRPGTSTTIDVQARLHLRSGVAPLATLGMAPLTSMFLGGENQPPPEDFRPEVHDSDGLQVHSGSGEWLWRPLSNPRGTFTTSFAMNTLRGFGLMQRDRQFASYEDLEARYELRPSVWVEPLGDWGAGRVELLQFRTPDETHDNVVAYWVPATLAVPGSRVDLAWRLHWQGADATLPPGAHVVQSRRGHGYREGGVPPGEVQFHVDFAGGRLPALAAAVQAASGPAASALQDAVRAMATGNDNVRDLRAVAYPHPLRGGWRVSLTFTRPDARRTSELRLFLQTGSDVLSETWSYALPPES